MKDEHDLQGDLFEGTPYERQEDTDFSEQYRQELAKITSSLGVSITMLDGETGATATVPVCEQSIEHLRDLLTKMKRSW